MIYEIWTTSTTRYPWSVAAVDGSENRGHGCWMGAGRALDGPTRGQSTHAARVWLSRISILASEQMVCGVVGL